MSCTVKKISWKKQKTEIDNSENVDINKEIQKNKQEILEVQKEISIKNENIQINKENEQIQINKENEQIQIPLNEDFLNPNEFNMANISESFKGVYINDYNILNIHYSILYNFKKQNDKIIQYNNNITTLKNKLTNTELKIFEIKNITKRIQEYLDLINDLKSNKNKENYINQTKNLLLEYSKIRPLKKIIKFKQSSKHIDEIIPDENSVNEARHEIISQYLEIAKEYIEINLIRSIDNSNTCKTCSSNLKEFIENEDLRLCPFCNTELDNFSKVVLSCENESKNLYRNNYSDETNFDKAILRFEGKQKNKIPSELFPMLDKHFLSSGYYNAETIKKWQYNEDENEKFCVINDNKIIANREILYEALTKTKNSTYYNDINLILHLYWNFKLPDLSPIKEKLKEDYAKTQKVFVNMEKERTSSLNCDFRLYKHLQLCGYKCKTTQFKIIKTPEIRAEYEILWKKMCDGAGLEYIPTN
jgi:hypothetical protein